MDNLFIGSVFLYLPIYIIFRHRLFSPLDPSAYMLFGRCVAPLYFFGSNINSFDAFWMWLFFICTAVFMLTFFVASPIYSRHISYTHTESLTNNKNIDTIWKFGLFLFLIKLVILLSIGSSLPIFTGEGSDAIVDFDRQDKERSSLLLSIGAIDFGLFYTVLPFVSKNRKSFLVMLLIFSALTSLSLSKKSAVINLLFTMAVAIYFRQFLGRVGKVWPRREKIVLAMFGAAGIIWSIRVLGLTREHFGSNASEETILATFDFFMYNLCYGMQTFFTEGSAFFSSINYSPYTYFFHSFLRVFGLRAFDYNIGEALGYYLTGDATGAAVNPTFIIEGYVLFGTVGAIIYSAIIGTIVGKVRRWIHNERSLVKKTILGSFLVGQITSLPVDSLFFIKTFIIYLGLAGIFFSMRRFMIKTLGSSRRIGNDASISQRQYPVTR